MAVFITGNSRDEILNGAPSGDNVIIGAGGNDTIIVDRAMIFSKE